jgi:hypothetical protein
MLIAPLALDRTDALSKSAIRIAATRSSTRDLMLAAGFHVFEKI